MAVIAIVAIGLGLFATAAEADVTRTQDCATVTAAASAAGSMQRLPDGEAAEVARGAGADAAVQSSITYLRGQGFDDSGEHVAFRDADGSTLVHMLHGSIADPDRSAASITHRIGTNGERTTELTMIGTDGGRPVPQASTEVLPGQALDFKNQKQTYTSCMLFCLSAQCGANAAKCNGIPHLGAKLACMLAVCGSHVPGCDRMCRALR